MSLSQYVFTPDVQVSLPVAGSDLRFPVGRVFCIGRNYPWPGADSPRSASVPFFMKPSSTVIDAEGDITYPPQTEEFCHEIELVVAIGESGANIAEDDALAYVWGYAAGLDLTRRDLQLQAKQQSMSWEAAKVFEGAAPVTAIVPVSQIGHPHKAPLWLKVNGQERQRGDLQQQLWTVSELIAQLSHSMPLRAGDLIMTGTPPGVAALNPGDLIEAGIDGIAQLRMQVAQRP